MIKGEQYVFNWATDGGMDNFDMHGELSIAAEKFTSYWMGRQQANAQGTFVAPFDGTHGWYWVRHHKAKARRNQLLIINHQC